MICPQRRPLRTFDIDARQQTDELKIETFLTSNSSSLGSLIALHHHTVWVRELPSLARRGGEALGCASFPVCGRGRRVSCVVLQIAHQILGWTVQRPYMCICSQKCPAYSFQVISNSPTVVSKMIWLTAALAWKYGSIASPSPVS